GVFDLAVVIGLTRLWRSLPDSDASGAHGCPRNGCIFESRVHGSEVSGVGGRCLWRERQASTIVILISSCFVCGRCFFMVEKYEHALVSYVALYGEGRPYGFFGWLFFGVVRVFGSCKSQP
ncbi:unnamed protein product, partial [Ectocarpus sp. 6 AP-2014]